MLDRNIAVRRGFPLRAISVIGNMRRNSNNSFHSSRGGAFDSASSTDTILEPFYVYDIEIPYFEEHNNICYFKIIVKAIGNVEWVVYRRYSNFFLLYENIHSLDSVSIVTEFPPKTYSFFPSKLTFDELILRRDRLQTWLREVVSISNASQVSSTARRSDLRKLRCEVSEFLDTQQNLYKAMLQAPVVVDIDDDELIDMAIGRASERDIFHDDGMQSEYRDKRFKTIA